MSDIYLLKFGGNTLNSESDLDRLAHEISELMENGKSIVVVHGEARPYPGKWNV